jgi:hypothetical protein
MFMFMIMISTSAHMTFICHTIRTDSTTQPSNVIHRKQARFPQGDGLRSVKGLLRALRGAGQEQVPGGQDQGYVCVVPTRKTTIALLTRRYVDGQFGAMMEVELVNDGPVTLQIDSRDK